MIRDILNIKLSPNRVEKIASILFSKQDLIALAKPKRIESSISLTNW